MATRFFHSAFDRVRHQGTEGDKFRDDAGERRSEMEFCLCGLRSDGAPAEAYNEPAFRYFLDIERKRSEASKQPFVLLLVDLKKQSLATSRVDSLVAEKLLSALAVCVRETDFIGWYRERSVAGAVLTQHSGTAESNLPEAVSRRITRVLHERLPSDLSSIVQVRVYQLPSSDHNVS